MAIRLEAFRLAKSSAEEAHQAVANLQDLCCEYRDRLEPIAKEIALAIDDLNEIESDDFGVQDKFVIASDSGDCAPEDYLERRETYVVRNDQDPDMELPSNKELGLGAKVGFEIARRKVSALRQRSLEQKLIVRHLKAAETENRDYQDTLDSVKAAISEVRVLRKSVLSELRETCRLLQIAFDA